MGYLILCFSYILLICFDIFVYYFILLIENDRLDTYLLFMHKLIAENRDSHFKNVHNVSKIAINKKVYIKSYSWGGEFKSNKKYQRLLLHLYRHMLFIL